MTGPRRRHVHDFITARAVLNCPEMSRAPALRRAGHPLERHVLNLDGAEHRQVRAAVEAAVDERVPHALPRVRPLARELLDRLPDGTSDLAGGFVRPLVLAVLDRLLDLSGGEPVRLQHWHDAAIGLETDRSDRWQSAARDLLDEVMGRNPVVARLRASGIAEDAVRATMFFLFSAGYVNTVNFLGLSLLSLARHPDQYAWLRGHRDEVTGAVEELLRYAEPRSRASLRVAAADTVVAGIPIARGTVVNVFRSSAGRDPARYHDPQRLDLRRRPASLAFGAGPHYCLGAGFVRSFADLALLALVDRVADLAPASSTAEDWDFADDLVLAVQKCPDRPVA